MTLRIVRREPRIEDLAVKLLGLSTPPETDTLTEYVTFVAKRLTFSKIEALRKRLSMDREPLVEILSISSRTYERRTQGGAASKLAGPNLAERVLRFARIRVLAERVLEDPNAAEAWLSEPQPGLAGRVPNDLLASEFGAREVEDLLNRIEHGVYV